MAAGVDGWDAQGLVAAQNPDGGWPYTGGGPSWTEPTAYALLAVMERAPAVEPARRACGWLAGAQLPDGGWPPEASVRRSTWVTAVVALLGPGVLGKASYQSAIAWILRHTGEDSNVFMRARQLLTGQPPRRILPGWPWFPSSSAWVTPTALAMAALRKAACGQDTPAIRARLDMGAAYLLAHTCTDGGWNYGAARVLDYDARSYPETTGVALLALAGNSCPAVRKACLYAQSESPVCQSSEAESWLRLGLLAHRQLPADYPPATRTPRTVQNAALALLARAAAAQGRSPLLE